MQPETVVLPAVFSEAAISLNETPDAFRHWILNKHETCPAAPLASSKAVNCPKSTKPSAPAVAAGLVPGVTYQLPPTIPSITKPLPALNSARSEVIPMFATASSAFDEDPMVNQLS